MTPGTCTIRSSRNGATAPNLIVLFKSTIRGLLIGCHGVDWNGIHEIFTHSDHISRMLFPCCDAILPDWRPLVRHRRSSHTPHSTTLKRVCFFQQPSCFCHLPFCCLPCLPASCRLPYQSISDGASQNSLFDGNDTIGCLTQASGRIRLAYDESY